MSDLEFDDISLKSGLIVPDDAVDDVTTFPSIAGGEKEEKKKVGSHPASKLFSCKICHQIFDLTPIEALKHKNMCKSE